jgi:hypothetical protein
MVAQNEFKNSRNSHGRSDVDGGEPNGERSDIYGLVGLVQLDRVIDLIRHGV